MKAPAGKATLGNQPSDQDAAGAVGLRSAGSGSRGRWYAAVVVLLLIVHSSLAISSLLRKGITFDEVEHISAGYAYLKFGDWRFNAEHPPLTKLFAAIPLVLGDVKPPEWDWGSPSESDGWKMGQRFLFDTSNDTQAMLNQTRMMMVVWSVVLGLVVYGWSAHLFGRPAGVLSVGWATEMSSRP